MEEKKDHWKHVRGGENCTVFDFADMLGWSDEDARVFGVHGAIKRGIPLEEALEHYEITEEFYNANIQRVLEDDDD